MKTKLITALKLTIEDLKTGRKETDELLKQLEN